jgi:predicted nuclease with TOPRIM domain
MPSPLTQQHSDIIKQLELALSKLKEKFQMADELKVKWLPNNDCKKSGEVLGRTIYIYEEDETKALDTLRHEFIDYIISIEFETPYKRLINKLIAAFEEEMYGRKERLIEKLLENI